MTFRPQRASRALGTAEMTLAGSPMVLDGSGGLRASPEALSRLQQPRPSSSEPNAACQSRQSVLRARPVRKSKITRNPVSQHPQAALTGWCGLGEAGPSLQQPFAASTVLQDLRGVLLNRLRTSRSRLESFLVSQGPFWPAEGDMSIFVHTFGSLKKQNYMDQDNSYG